jgi:hypothetical protein
VSQRPIPDLSACRSAVREGAGNTPVLFYVVEGERTDTASRQSPFPVPAHSPAPPAPVAVALVALRPTDSDVLLLVVDHQHGPQLPGGPHLDGCDLDESLAQHGLCQGVNGLTGADDAQGSAFGEIEELGCVIAEEGLTVGFCTTLDTCHTSGRTRWISVSQVGSLPAAHRKLVVRMLEGLGS